MNRLLGNLQKPRSVVKKAGILLAVAAMLVPTADTALAIDSTTANSLTTGATHACATTGGTAKCWGYNGNGELGNGDSGWKNETKPVAVVSKAAWVETVPASTSCFLWCTTTPEKKINHAATGLGGKYVTKISAGTDHTCAVASATVYCWGNNANGQLGNGKSGLFQQEDEPVAVVRSGALTGKEIVDVSAGDAFTCALASDGTVACWGKGENGRLGNGSTTDKNTPTAIYTAGAMNGKKGRKLAKASGSTMCVVSTTGVPYCWGYGIDDGTALPSGSSSEVKCSSSSPTSVPSTTASSTFFSNTKPTLVSGAILAAVDGDDYVTGLGSNGQAYYWGMYGYETRTTYVNSQSCKVNPCTGKVSIQRTIRLAGVSVQRNVSGGNKSYGNIGHGTAYRSNGNGTGTSYTETGGSKNCNLVTHYGFTKNITATYIGKKSATLPPATTLTSGVSAMSGKVYADQSAYVGLYCAVKANIVSCDGNGSVTTAGQLGNGKTVQLSGPQIVVGTGWLSGKQVTQLSTGSTGYTCAIASGSVGCWGVNTNGQLGVNSGEWWKAVPTGVGL